MARVEADVGRSADFSGPGNADGSDRKPQKSAEDAGEPPSEADDARQLCPIDVFAELPLPVFPIRLLPAQIADYAVDQAGLMGIDPSIVGMGAVTVLCACLHDGIIIQPKRHDPTWTESARIWFASIGGPSTMKTPGLTKALRPALLVDRDWRKHSDELLERWKKDCERTKKENPDATLPRQPMIKRLLFADTTVEKLGDVLSRCEPRGCLVHRDELAGWIASMDAYKGSSGADRAAWLEAYNGGSHAVDRINRGSQFVENWSACVVGGIQPSAIEKLARSDQNDGLLQRFILVYARDSVAGEDRAPAFAAGATYEALIKYTAKLLPQGASVLFSEDAHVIREAFDDRIRKTIRNIPNPLLTAALGKWPGLFARLCLSFHVAEMAARSAQPIDEKVSADTASRVDRLIWETFLPHAIRFYQAVDDGEDKVRLVAALLLAKGWNRFSVKRDLDRHLKQSRIWKGFEIEETISRLVSYGWLQTPAKPRVDMRGNLSAYEVNPEVHRRFRDKAAQERERRRAVVELLRREIASAESS